MKINKIAVIGAGVMGSGIAAQVANAGYPVVLLDIVPPGAYLISTLTLPMCKRLWLRKCYNEKILSAND